MIYATELSRFYDNKLAVDGLTFHVHRGEVMGLLGPNGAGKSTTMKMLSGFLPPSSGSASIAGINLQDDLCIRQQLGYLPEHAPSYLELNVDQHLQFIGRLHGLPRATLRDRIVEMGSACGLQQVMSQPIEALSKGYRQRVGLAASMLHDPACLILDEPTTGLDPNQLVEIRQLIRRLAEKKTILLSSHVLSEVEAVCDRMMIIDAGQLKAIGRCDELIALAQAGVVLHVRVQGSIWPIVDKLLKKYAGCQADVNPNDESMATFKHEDASTELAQAVFKIVVDAGETLLELRPEKISLEDVFHRMTKYGESR
ncbi:MAG: ATP-binding cassette domain-containing protein [Mariprofundaceae bacterium]